MIFKILIPYLLIINFIGFWSMRKDKRKAISHEYRIPEKRLFTYALLGGSLGSILGMRLYHHKTKHLLFVIGMPIILIIQIVIATALYKIAWS